jgi:diaminopimelate epimerase
MINASKYHGNGNDFIVVAPAQVQEEHYAALAQAICDHHFGVGADGCVFVGEISAEHVSLRIFNRDGSEARMSGNGFRCGCAFLHHRSLLDQTEVTLMTASGVKGYTLLEQEEGFWTFQSRMGDPVFDPEAVPFRAPNTVQGIQGYSLVVAGEQVSIAVLSVGNPQCVVFLEELPLEEEFRRLGRGLEVHPDFPERTNVSFVQVVGSNQLKIRLWERGVGPTHSSGTGSCGAAVAAIRAGKVQSPVQVSTETGSQQVEWDGETEILLTGNARFIAEINFYWEHNG